MKRKTRALIADDEDRLMKLAQALADLFDKTAVVENVRDEPFAVAPRDQQRLGQLV
jgi:predicted component of type VI protein secretion system